MAYPERIVPDETGPGIVAIHLKRYEFARPLCAGRDVLDAAWRYAGTTGRRHLQSRTNIERDASLRSA